MILSHFTSNPFSYDSGARYERMWNPYKPHGLWLSDEKDIGWTNFCKSEQWNMLSLKHRTDFEIVDSSKWAILKTTEEIIQFGRAHMVGESSRFSMSIDWNKVADKYDAILITPYQWAARNNPDSFWYYGWDCASACVWNLKTIRQVKT